MVFGHGCGMKLDHTVQVWKEGKQFIAHAMPLDVASSGLTPEAARKAMDEAVELFVATAARHGTLKEVLEDSGY
jgi:predicted RNase H-like HicB family nuclease